jgi:hypothetical protein
MNADPRHLDTAPPASRALRILLLCHSFNSLSQRLYAELTALGTCAVGGAGHRRRRDRRGGCAVPA